MTCTTFLHDGELNVPTSNNELNSILKEIRQKSGEDWQIIERSVEIHEPFWKFWKPVKWRKSYELYKFVGGIGPWQQINFYRDNTDWSINLSNPAELVMAFLYGMLAGMHVQEMKNDAR